MEDKKNAKKDVIDSPEEKKDALAGKESDSLNAVPKAPLMTVKAEGESKSKEEKAPETEEEPDLESLKTSLEEKNRLLEEYRERLMRTQADFENFKKRMEKEKIDFRNNANAQLAREVLVIMDDYQKALDSQRENVDETIIKGFELIYRNLYGILEKEGLSLIDAANKKFDPWKHEAIEMVPTKEHPENTVIGIVQNGYMFKDKVLRPAKVRVAKLPQIMEEGVKEDKGGKDLKSDEEQDRFEEIIDDMENKEKKD